MPRPAHEVRSSGIREAFAGLFVCSAPPKGITLSGVSETFPKDISLAKRLTLELLLSRNYNAKGARRL